MGGFHAKHSCTSRVYHYVVPSYLFDAALSDHIDLDRAKEKGRKVDQIRRRQMEETGRRWALKDSSTTLPPPPRPTPPRGEEGSGNEDDGSEGEVEGDSDVDDGFDDEVLDISDEYRARLLSYRMPSALRERVSSILHRFEGSLNYYNYTRHKKIKNREDKAAAQPSRTDTPPHSHSNASTTRAAPCTTTSNHNRRLGPRLPVNVDFYADRNTRVMLDVSIESTFTEPASGLELLIIRLHGQSFMLNQIRKMVGIAALLARGLVQDEVFERSFKQRGLYIPTAPSLGLYLDRCTFQQYDGKCRQRREEEQLRRLRKAAAAPADSGDHPDAVAPTPEKRDGGEDADVERIAVDEAYQLHEAAIQGPQQTHTAQLQSSALPSLPLLQCIISPLFAFLCCVCWLDRVSSRAHPAWHLPGRSGGAERLPMAGRAGLPPFAVGRGLYGAAAAATSAATSTTAAPAVRADSRGHNDRTKDEPSRCCIDDYRCWCDVVCYQERI